MSTEGFDSHLPGTSLVPAASASGFCRKLSIICLSLPATRFTTTNVFHGARFFHVSGGFEVPCLSITAIPHVPSVRRNNGNRSTRNCNGRNSELVVRPCVGWTLISTRLQGAFSSVFRIRHITHEQTHWSKELWISPNSCCYK